MPTPLGLNFFGAGAEDVIRTALLRMSRPVPREETGASQAAIAEAIKNFAVSLAFVLHVPGRHYSGLSNNALLAIMAEQGRDFGAKTRPLQEHVKQALLAEFAGGRRVPSAAEMKAIASDAIVEWVVMRFEGKVHDVSMAALSPKYRAWKRKEGLSSRIGVATGELMSTIQDSATALIH